MIAPSVEDNKRTHNHNGHQVCMSSVLGAVVYCHYWLQLHNATVV